MHGMRGMRGMYGMHGMHGMLHLLGGDSCTLAHGAVQRRQLLVGRRDEKHRHLAQGGRAGAAVCR